MTTITEIKGVKIQSGIKMLNHTKKNGRFPWTDVLLNTVIGDSFVCTNPYTSMIAHVMAKRVEMQVAVRREGNNFRVFRIS